MSHAPAIAVVFAAAIALIPAVSGAAELTEVKLPPPAVAEPLTLTPAEARRLWHDEFRSEMPADLVAFAVPDIQAGFRPDLADGVVRGIEIAFGIRSVQLIRIADPRLDACTIAARDGALATARGRIPTIDAAARRSVARQAQPIARAGVAEPGDALRVVGDRIDPILISVRRALLESIAATAFIHLPALAAEGCAAPSAAPQPAPAVPPAAGAAPSPPGAPESDVLVRQLQNLQLSSGRRR